MLYCYALTFLLRITYYKFYHFLKSRHPPAWQGQRSAIGQEVKEREICKYWHCTPLHHSPECLLSRHTVVRISVCLDQVVRKYLWDSPQDSILLLQIGTSNNFFTSVNCAFNMPSFDLLSCLWIGPIWK